jgi:hypothetical protein
MMLIELALLRLGRFKRLALLDTQKAEDAEKAGLGIERIEIAPILVYVIGPATMLGLSAAYNICLARQMGSAPLRPLRDAGLGSRALAYLQLVSRTCR